MVSCGIEIAARRAVFVFLRSNGETVETVDAPSARLDLRDDDDPDALLSFHRAAARLLDAVNPSRVGILERKKFGNFAASGTTFKMEALLQLNPGRKVVIVPAAAFRSFLKDRRPEAAPRFRYQKNAYLLALFLLEEAES